MSSLIGLLICMIILRFSLCDQQEEENGEAIAKPEVENLHDYITWIRRRLEDEKPQDYITWIRRKLENESSIYIWYLMTLTALKMERLMKRNRDGQPKRQL